MSPEPHAGPVNYDTATIHIDPVAVQSAANVLKAECGHVIDALGNIVHVLDALRLGWAGTSAEEAQAFSARWVAVASQLFGTEAAVGDDELDAGDGVLNVLTAGLAGIVEGYSESEMFLKKLLDEFKTGLGQTQPASYSTPASVPADAVTAVNETWP